MVRDEIRGEFMNKFIAFSIASTIFLGSASFLLEANATQKKLDLKPSFVETKKESPRKGRGPVSVDAKKATKPMNPLLERTDMPQGMGNRSDSVSCEASTAYYGKTCTSRFLSF
jgi:hypothetical protein